MFKHQSKLFSRPFLLIILIILITSAAVTILIIDKNFSFNLNLFGNTSKSNVAFSDYDKIKTELTKLIASDLNNPKKALRDKALGKLILLENKNITTKDAYLATQATGIYIGSSYSETHDPRDRVLLNNLGIFAKNNFPKQYNIDDFATECQDKTCQDEPTPTEITKIIDKIKASDMPAVVSNSLINNLLISVYISKNNRYDKYTIYYQVVEQLNDYSEFSPSKTNLPIAKELQDFIDKNYPLEKDQYLKDIETIKKRQEQYKNTKN